LKQELTAARLRELFHYDPETGVFLRRVKASNSEAGTPPRGVNSNRYLRFSVDGEKYYAHRLAWLYVYGAWPKNDTDHINGDRQDNRIRNLRDVSRGVNMQNQRRARSNNFSSGVLGVSWHKGAGKWCASIKVDGRMNYLGLHEDKAQAQNVYLDAKRRLHKGCTI
jgi:hypothetical protein